MLTRQFPFLDPAAIPIDLSERLQSLADNCAMLAQFGAAPPSQLRTAPLLERYLPAISSLGVRLIGQVTGHPVLGTRKIITSQVWFADPKGEWVRTLSRYYRLGQPADTDDEADEPPITPTHGFGGAMDH